MTIRHSLLAIAVSIACIACHRTPAADDATTSVSPQPPPAASAPAQGIETSAPPAPTAPSGKLAATDPVAQLANLATLGTLKTDAPDVASYLQTHFNDACTRHDALPFDEVCDHERADAAASDPSPWPDLMLGLRERRIVSAVLFHPAQQLGGWHCDAVPGMTEVRACTPGDIAATDRAQWLDAWAAFFRAAD